MFEVFNHPPQGDNIELLIKPKLTHWSLMNNVATRSDLCRPVGELHAFHVQQLTCDIEEYSRRVPHI
jgi:hypothetical protein